MSLRPIRGQDARLLCTSGVADANIGAMVLYVGIYGDTEGATCQDP